MNDMTPMLKTETEVEAGEEKRAARPSPAGLGASPVRR